MLSGIDLGSRHRLDRRVARGKSDEGARLRRAHGHCTRNRRRRDRSLRVWLARTIVVECDWLNRRVVCGSGNFDLAGPAIEKSVMHCRNVPSQSIALWWIRHSGWGKRGEKIWRRNRPSVFSFPRRINKRRLMKNNLSGRTTAAIGNRVLRS